MLALRPSFLSCLFVVILCLSWCVSLVALLLFLAWLCAFGKTANVPPNALAYVSLNNIPSVNIFVMSVGLMLVKSDLNLTSETRSGILILSTFEMS